ncbi:MAG: UDP-3-O-(3-hydroxymyristoyl)glucosamine N-acyltransferase [Gammaproteobacteria bacterium RIFCSPHIGHO2_12_FULL_45_9]|nr:MAG: UDP-3-O-(3-hydroxymyristoyl)glucosamine N-acyltransferase [Gammaproteobacteria bacterium RIFCSPHIGHO2_12_FULL_45_9]
MYTVSTLSSRLGLVCEGEPDRLITGAATIRSAGTGDLVFFDGKSVEARDALVSTHAAAVVLSPQDAQLLAGTSVPRIVAPNPKLAFARALSILFPDTLSAQSEIHVTAVIADDVVLGECVKIGAHVVIGQGTTIGSHCVLEAGVVLGERVTLGEQVHLYPRVVVYDEVMLGNRVIIHAGAVIGADGFGYVPDERGQWVKLQQRGRVRIGDDVEIGANATVDRGALEDTVVGQGVKLDDLVMIAHNVTIGDHTVIAGCSVVGGSSHIGQHCLVGGRVAISDHVDITDHVILTGTAAVSHALREPGVYSSGMNVKPHREWRRNIVRFWQLEKWVQRLRFLEKRILTQAEVAAMEQED